MSGLIIGLDFDGTVVTHEYPKIGKPLPRSIDVLKRCLDAGAKFCLNTMRSGELLDEAVSYLQQNGIQLYGINTNPEQKSWTQSSKVYAHLYIDDAALGAPVVEHPDFSDRPFICWATVEAMLFPEKL